MHNSGIFLVEVCPSSVALLLRSQIVCCTLAC